MTVERALLGTTDATTAANYIEDVFSTYLYTGNGSTQTINNGINLSTKGGLVWLKARQGTNFPESNYLFDTNRGATKFLVSNNTAAEGTNAAFLTSFSSTGFNINSGSKINQNLASFASWTFRKQAKFFDVVTYTGNGSNRTIAHSLGSVPGCIIVRMINGSSNWIVYHSSVGNTKYFTLESTDAAATGANIWNNTSPTSSVFSVGSNFAVNSSGNTFVAYLFAHNAGGFGATGTDNVISCGSYTGNGSATGPSVTIGYEPQYVMVKASSTTGNWVVLDVMRGMSQTNSQELFPNLSNAEAALNPGIIPTATGFTLGTTNADLNNSATTYIYMAIRRGPMKVPTDGTKVFVPVTQTGSTIYDVTFSSLPYVDSIISWKDRAGGGMFNAPMWNDRLRGFPSDMTGVTYVNNPGLASSTVDAENTAANPSNSNYLSGVTMNRAVWGGGWASLLGSFQGFRRAPGFFDVVCYTGTGVARTVSHNLGVVPEMMIVKARSTPIFGTANWVVYAASLGSAGAVFLNTTGSFLAGTYWNSTQPTASVFSISSADSVNANNTTYVAYLFASVPGVSKVGSYTGTGAAQTINCGFTGGARFVLIKRTNSTGDWYVWDTARGIVAGNDPYLLLNSTAAEVTNTDYIDPYAAGFEISSTAPAAINANGGTFIYLAIA